MQTPAIKTKLSAIFISLFLLAAPLAASHDISQEKEGVEVWGGLAWARGDDFKSKSSPNRDYVMLHTKDGQTLYIQLSPEQVKALGGFHRLHGKRVKIKKLRRLLSLIQNKTNDGSDPEHAIEAEHIDEEPSVMGAGEAGGAAAAAALAGPVKWATILVKFSDSPGSEPHPLSFYNSLMGMSYSGMGDFWRENSYNNIDMSGNASYGWFTLPQPRSYYITTAPDGSENADLDRMKNDAVAVSDGSIHFPSFDGINIVFNQNIGCCAWGGSSYVNADGQNRLMRTTWMPLWGIDNPGVVAHEMGHGLGFDHASGPYDGTYDSNWNPMSNAFFKNPPVHVNSYHKDYDGWIPAARIYTGNNGSNQEITLEGLAQPANAAGKYLMAKIPTGTNTFYAVEARFKRGYDNGIMNNAVIIWNVDTTRGDRKSQTVDGTNNGDPNDDGVMWTPGETFSDVGRNISVSVISQTADGFVIRVNHNGSNPTPTFTPTQPPSLGNGLCASYWNNTGLSGAACAMRTEATVNFDWGSGGPGVCNNAVDQFSARFSGQIQAPFSGTYTLYLRGDDGIRLWATNPANNVESLLIDKWILQGPTEYSAVLPFSLNAGQKANLRIEYYENGGGAVCQLSYSGPNTPKQIVPQGRLYSGACALPTPTPTHTPTEVPGSGNGLCASYFDNMDLAGAPCGMRTEAQLNFDWGAGGPGLCNNRVDQFSARFSGEIQAPYAGTYRLYLTGDDGIRLWVTNPANNAESLLIDKWILQGPTEYSATLPFSLNAGQKAAIRIEFFENGGGALCSLSWDGPGVAKQLIPKIRLYSGACLMDTPTSSATQTWTATATQTRTWTPTPTWTWSDTPVVVTGTATATWTWTSTPLDTDTPTWTSTWTSSRTATPTATKTLTPLPPTSTWTATRTNTWTQTRTWTPTATKTLTPVPPQAAVSLNYRNPDLGDLSGSPHPQFGLQNMSGAAIQLTEYEIRYWLNCDCNGSAMQAWLDWSSIPGTAVDIVSAARGTQTHYVRVRFTQGYGLLPNAIAEVHTRFNKSDWSNMSQNNDHSFGSVGAFIPWTKATVYRNGVLVWGAEPSMAAAGEGPSAARALPKQESQLSMPPGKTLVSAPNPASTVALARFALAEGGKARLLMSNFSETVYHKDLGELGAGVHEELIPVAGFADGVYFLRLLLDKGYGYREVALFKMVKKKS